VAEALWSILPIGGGGYIAAGVTACDDASSPSGLGGLDPDPDNCPLGNNARIWRSSDGVKWSMVKDLPLSVGTGRTTLAVGPVSDPKSTVVYAYVGETNGGNTVGFWHSTDGGATWS